MLFRSLASELTQWEARVLEAVRREASAQAQHGRQASAHMADSVAARPDPSKAQLRAAQGCRICIGRIPRGSLFHAAISAARLRRGCSGRVAPLGAAPSSSVLFYFPVPPAGRLSPGVLTPPHGPRAQVRAVLGALRSHEDELASIDARLQAADAAQRATHAQLLWAQRCGAAAGIAAVVIAGGALMRHRKAGRR